MNYLNKQYNFKCDDPNEEENNDVVGDRPNDRDE